MNGGYRGLLILLAGVSIWLSVSTSVKAQQGRVVQTSFEINRTTQPEDFNIIPFQDKRLALLYRNESGLWKIRFFDRQLKEQRILELPFVGSSFVFENHYQLPTHTLLFFSAKGKKAQLIEVSINHKDYGLSHRGYALPRRAIILDLFHNNNGIFVYYRQKKKEGILFVDRNGKSKEIITAASDIALVFKPFIGENFSYHALSRIKSKKSIRYSMIKLDNNGQIIEEVTPKLPDDFYATRGYLMQTQSGSIICFGSWSSSVYTAMETGVFSFIPAGGEEAGLRLFPFNEFKHSLIVPSQIRKIEKARRRGRKPEISHMLLPHFTMPAKGDTFYFASEVYYPQYSYEQRYNPNTRMFETYQVFEGYLFTHAIACAFDHTGKLLWDNNIENNQVLTYTLRPITRLHPDGENLVLMYPFEENLVYKVINGYETIEKRESMDITSGTTPGRSESTWFSSLDYWYDDTFVVSGIRRIRETGKSRSWEFFIRKMAYR